MREDILLKSLNDSLERDLRKRKIVLVIFACFVFLMPIGLLLSVILKG
ncbi:hypothetical protein P5641_00095 (plasmid) [Bacillus subtilis]|nr:hypothetical protein [Bacillus halotolerans]WEY94572.1 hypothetical protein P5641_00095 [Bacillus subtilis]WJE41186.1 hypothetical protein QRD86_00085 [Bacillus halotolerans]